MDFPSDGSQNRRHGVTQVAFTQAQRRFHRSKDRFGDGTLLTLGTLAHHVVKRNNVRAIVPASTQMQIDQALFVRLLLERMQRPEQCIERHRFTEPDRTSNTRFTMKLHSHRTSPVGAPEREVGRHTPLACKNNNDIKIDSVNNPLHPVASPWQKWIKPYNDLMVTAKDIIVELSSPTEADVALINKAYDLAAKAHESHTRYSGEPYIVHLAEVGLKLAKMGMGPRTIAAGLLHDIIEDTTVSAQDIRDQFGEEILFLVEGVTKLSSVRYYGSDRHNESLRKLFVATSQDIRVLIIKLTDRLHNMETLHHVPSEKQMRIARETLEIYVPVAHRLGMGRIRKELEDLAFPYVYPDEYKRVRELLAKSTEKSMQTLERERKALQKKLAESGLLDFNTSYRVKGYFSLFHKLKRKDWDISDVYDLLAMRVVVKTVEDCYKALGVIHEMWRPLPKRVKDYIAFPKPNGYQSIHTTVTTVHGTILEIQIRTQKMHHEAEYGVASHIIYKLAMRVVVKTVEDCYKALGVIHEMWRPLPKRVKDYIAFPKPNGYQSIHTTVTTVHGTILEIQIRTQKMHHEAEYGVASHIIYKQTVEKAPKGGASWFSNLIPSLFRPFAWREQVKQPSVKITKDTPHHEKIPRWINQIGEMYTSEKASGDEFMSDMRKDFFQNRIFVFTPNGDVVDLPTSASPIDFAYAIHSEVGDHIAGVKVNNKLVQLDTELKNGDIVQVETRKSSHPTQKWLTIAQTSLAKRRIRAYLAEHS